ncbi:MAG TPA: nucleotide sugar dehydrogenase [Candidatus Paceibacterota bacterium]|jgi:UDP-N-acetyl-D-glucosamine dehydrogenase|nr:nucleotide sugar dehydrogenase [Candidatus Paceibacterota bacterium]HOH11136.1 nucleotide sugar dehydrogenase [Candidatus Paceibacterota bacterium]HOY11149.1 nucleotide sugar dehydrogenase [Candidatus Paceibacterota bacterium]HPI24761.1 nucleotide sugar dehydrogenase [Candidatus Paceibacterota bacterium]HQF41081.1 nucleotide sugar dehydrogenase [Candidatus Paceibacterota bacterium]
MGKNLKKNKRGKTIGVVGLGYVGLPLALLADKKGYEVIGVDINQEKVDKLKKKVPPFEDAKVEKLIKESGFKATTDFAALKTASVIVICVPTPVNKKHLPDLVPLEEVSKALGLILQRGQLVVLESTVNPGVSEGVVLPFLQKNSGLIGGKDFYLAHCPERINPGDPFWDVENIPRVIGSLEEVGLARATDFYRSILKAEVKQMDSLKEAEAVKVVENSFRDINIAFVNELAMSFSKLGIDVVNVLNGAATKPFAFMRHLPGCGVGGHCIPVDPYYLIKYAKENGFNHNFLKLARKINNYMPEFTTKLLIEGLRKKKIEVVGARVTVLGLAYKPNVDDCRESPAFKIIENLKKQGIKVSVFDPHVLNRSTSPSLGKSLAGSQAVMIVTGHRAFSGLTPEFLKSHGVSVVIDGRNFLPKESFNNSDLVYLGIGR